jgi:hypothetical protein
MHRNSKIVLSIFLFISTTFSSPLDWRIYSNENSAWFCSSSEIQIFTPASRSLRPLTIDQARLVNRLYDFVMYDGYLWVSSDAGIYKIDMNTMGAERIALPGDSILDGRIAVDMDFVWVLTNKELFKYDQLGQEWLHYPLPESASVVNGVYSTGEEVFCICSNKLYRYTVSTEKWNSYPISKEIAQLAQLSPGSASFKFIDEAFVKVYKPSSFSWENINTSQPVCDYIDEDSVVYYCAGKNVYKMNSENGSIRPFDIPGIDTVYAVEKLSDTILVATGKRLIKYDTKSLGMDFIEYFPDMNASELEKVVVQGSFVVLVYKSSFAIYDKENRGWQIIQRSSLKKDIKRFSWDNDGLTTRYAPGYQSVLRGSLQDGVVFKYEGYTYDTITKIRMIDGEPKKVITKIDSAQTLSYTIPKLPLMNLSLHTSDPNDRTLDAFINNTSLSTPTEKGIFYKGNRDDRLNNIKLGKTSNDQLSSVTLPQVQLEGVSAGVESKKRVEGRDRKIIKVAAGSGFITSRTEWRTLPYRSSGNYYLMKKKKSSADTSSLDTSSAVEADTTEKDTSKVNSDTLQIIPGSVRVWVDGVMLDSTYYTFYSPTSKLQFTTNAPVDPASAITIQYKIQTIPEKGIDDVEFIPTHDFGVLNFGSVTVSPKDWISARLGFSGISRDSSVYPSGVRTVSPIVNLSTPIEFRKEKPNLFLKLNPEYSYNTTTGKQAGSASLQSRLGSRTGIILNGMFADDGYFTTDTLTYGYGAVRQQYDATVSYDVKTELPVKYYQHYRYAENGTESRYSASAGAHFQGFPFLDVTLSRTSVDHHPVNDSVPTAFDSLWNTKDKLHLRLYETSSKLLEQLTHIKRISYNIAHSEYRRTFEDDEWLAGRMTTAEFTVAPTNQVIFTGNLYFRNDENVLGLPSSVGRPSLELQTIDAPRGVDFHALYYINYGKYKQGDTCTDTINRTIDIILKPGMWHPAFKWFSPRFGISNNLACRFGSAQPGFGNVVVGNSGETVKNVRKEVGVNIFPSDAILIRNKNEFINIDTNEVFQTTNDIQIWLGSKNFWQGIWNYSTKDEQYTLNLNYDRVWTPWLRTSPGFNAEHVNDSLGSKLKYGPSLKINLNFMNFGFLKLLTNSNDLRVDWEKRNETVKTPPGLTYSFNLTIVMLPNMQINNYEAISYKEGILADFQSRSSLIINF